MSCSYVFMSLLIILCLFCRQPFPVINSFLSDDVTTKCQFVFLYFIEELLFIHNSIPAIKRDKDITENDDYFIQDLIHQQKNRFQINIKCTCLHKHTRTVTQYVFTYILNQANLINDCLLMQIILYLLRY